jgi:NTE family protein
MSPTSRGPKALGRPVRFPYDAPVSSPIPRTGIVLSGGGARGAYEVGVVAGIIEVLGDRGYTLPPFQVLCGTSVGAINCAYLASHAHMPGMNLEGLVAAWESLRLEEHLRLDVRGLLDMPRALLRGATDPGHAPSVLDSAGLEDMVETTIAWPHLHANVAAGLVHAVIVAALEIGTGRTTLFTETAPAVTFAPSRDPRRVCRPTRLDLDHIMASAALPLLFPPRQIDGAHYCDGGVRFNTPIAPAIRAGSDRLVVIGLQYEGAGAPRDLHSREVTESYANPAFLLGKLLDALLLDPTRYDLHVLERLNDLIEHMERSLSPAQLEAFDDAVRKGRNMPYRRLDTLVFRPTADIGQLAHEHSPYIARRGLSARLLMRFATRGTQWENDLLSFMLFDGGFARRLIELGRSDALARADDIARFYGL